MKGMTDKRRDLEDQYNLVKEEIMEERLHACEGCGAYGKKISFSHRIPRSKDISQLANKENIDLYCIGENSCHDLWEAGKWDLLINGPYAMEWLKRNDPELWQLKINGNVPLVDEQGRPLKVLSYPRIGVITPRSINGQYMVDLRSGPLCPTHTIITGIASLDAHAVKFDTENVYNYRGWLEKVKSKDREVANILNKIYSTVKSGHNIDLVWWYKYPNYADVVRVVLNNVLKK
jgi:hypothetical protein